MRQRVLGIQAGAIGALAFATAFPAWSQSIGIFFDPFGARCSAEVGPKPITSLYVLAFPAGEVAGGAEVVEFRIAGKPESWTPLNSFWVTEAPGAFTVGNPLHEWNDGTPHIGGAIAFGGCRGNYLPPDDKPPILLGTIRLVLAPTPNDVHLRIDRPLPPLHASDPPCPFMVACSSFFKICAAGGEAFLNSTGPDCTVGVGDASWSGIKRLYE